MTDPITARPPRIRPAGLADQGPVEALLATAGLPLAGVRHGLPGFWVADLGGTLCGVVGLEVYGSVGLLRSAAVRDEDRGSGVGGALVRHLLRDADERGIEAVYLLTETAEHYFPRHGFAVVPRTELPPELNGSAELQGACPASAVAMMRRRP
jgi:amino-acid N-acetyltransferase